MLCSNNIFRYIFFLLIPLLLGSCGGGGGGGSSNTSNSDLSICRMACNLNPVNEYTYDICLANCSSSSGGDNPTPPAPTPTDTTPPKQPTLTASLSALNQITLTMQQGSSYDGVDRYEVIRGGVLIATTSYVSYVDSYLRGQSTFCYTIIAIDAAGNRSIASSAACIATSPSPLKRSVDITSVSSLLEPHNSVAGSDGTIYGWGGGWDINAMNPDGTLKWSFTADGILGRPVVGADGTIYFGGYKTIYVLNLDGTLKWTYTVGNNLRVSDPLIGGGDTIYFTGYTAGSGKIVALNLDGTLKWKKVFIESDSWLTAIGTDGTPYLEVVVRGRTTDSDIYKLQALNFDGTLKWEYQIDSPISATTAFASDGTIYFGTIVGWNKINVRSSGKLQALNPNGTLKWQYASTNIFTGNISIDNDGTIYLRDNRLHAVNPDGTSKWITSVTDTYFPSDMILVNNDTIFQIGSCSGCSKSTLEAVRLDGTRKWTYIIDANDAKALLWVKNDILIFGRSKLYSFDVLYK